MVFMTLTSSTAPARFTLKSQAPSWSCCSYFFALGTAHRIRRPLCPRSHQVPHRASATEYESRDGHGSPLPRLRAPSVREAPNARRPDDSRCRQRRVSPRRQRWTSRRQRVLPSKAQQHSQHPLLSPTAYHPLASVLHLSLQSALSLSRRGRALVTACRAALTSGALPGGVAETKGNPGQPTPQALVHARAGDEAQSRA